jgi:AAA domain
MKSLSEENYASNTAIVSEWEADLARDLFRNNPERELQFQDKFLNANEFMAMDINYDYLIDGWVPQEGITLMNGSRGSGKSTAAIDMAVHIAADRDWHGTPVDKGWTVLYIAAEDDKGLKARLQASHLHYFGEEKTPKLGRLHVFRGGFNILDPKEVMAFANEVCEHTRPDAKIVFIVDTWGRMTSRAESQSNEADMQKAIHHLEALARAFDGPAIVLTHPPANNSNKVAGTKIIENMSHSIIQIGEAVHGTISMRVNRVKGAEGGNTKKWKIVSQEISGQDKHNKPRNAARFQYLADHDAIGKEGADSSLSDAELKMLIAHGLAEVLDANNVDEVSVKKAAEWAANMIPKYGLQAESQNGVAKKLSGMRELQNLIPAHLAKIVLLNDGRQLCVVPAANGKGKIVRITNDEIWNHPELLKHWQPPINLNGRIQGN